MKRTNWEKYYSSPAPTAFFARAIVRRHLLRMIRETDLNGNFSIAELGGGGSCFYEKIKELFDGCSYRIYDSCPAGIQAFLAKHPEGNAVETDLLTYQPEILHDLVFSVGLIEHFPPEQTARMIRKHFEMTRPGGYVVIFVPTPTLLYRATRNIAELLEMWQFPDERPVTKNELRMTADQCGTFLKGVTIRANFLSQYAVLYRKQKDENTENL